MLFQVLNSVDISSPLGPLFSDSIESRIDKNELDQETDGYLDRYCQLKYVVERILCPTGI